MSIRFIQVGLIPPLLFSASMAASARTFDKLKLGDSEINCQVLFDKAWEKDALTAIDTPTHSQTSA